MSTSSLITSGWIRADDRRWCIYLGKAVLGTAPLALGLDVQRRSTSTLPREPTRRADDGCPPAWADREHLVLGRAEAHRERCLRGLESRDRQDDRRWRLSCDPMELRSCRCIRDWFGRRRSWKGLHGSTSPTQNLPSLSDGLSLHSPRIPTSSGTPEPYWWPPA